MSTAATITEYLVSHGKSGALGRFASPALPFRRGQRVVVQTYRGLEMGRVLCEATERHRKALPHAPGQVVRQATSDDERQADGLEDVARRILVAVGQSHSATVEVLDAEIMLDGRRAILHYLGKTEVDIEPLLKELSTEFQVEVFAENLASPTSTPEEHGGGCGKPDCGKTGGGCTSCESGGCSSCGHGGVDMTAYFAHLRGRMEASGRVPLV